MTMYILVHFEFKIPQSKRGLKYQQFTYFFIMQSFSEFRYISAITKIFATCNML